MARTALLDPTTKTASSPSSSSTSASSSGGARSSGRRRRGAGRPGGGPVTVGVMAQYGDAVSVQVARLLGMTPGPDPSAVRRGCGE
jgi:hypothetical protein